MLFSAEKRLLRTPIGQCAQAGISSTYMTGAWDWAGYGISPDRGYKDKFYNGLDGTANNGAWVSAQGILTLDGTDDYVGIGDYSLLQFERTDPFSGYAWIKTTQADKGTVFGKRLISSGAYRGYLFSVNNGDLELILGHDAATDRIKVTTSLASPVNDGDWHSIGFSYDGSSAASGVTLYVDSSPVPFVVDDDTLTGTIDVSTPFQIGIWHTTDKPFAGEMKYVFVFDTELTDQQHNNLYTIHA